MYRFWRIAQTTMIVILYLGWINRRKGVAIDKIEMEIRRLRVVRVCACVRVCVCACLCECVWV